MEDALLVRSVATCTGGGRAPALPPSHVSAPSASLCISRTGRDPSSPAPPRASRYLSEEGRAAQS